MVFTPVFIYQPFIRNALSRPVGASPAIKEEKVEYKGSAPNVTRNILVAMAAMLAIVYGLLAVIWLFL